MSKCIFCSKEIRIGKGKVLIKNSGKQIWFCSRKCEISYEMGRDPRKFKWTSNK